MFRVALIDGGRALECAASETRKVEAKLASCLLRSEGQTEVSCEYDM